MAAKRTQSVLFADPRTRRKIQMQDEGKDRYSVASLVSSNLLLVVALAVAKLWLLDRQVPALYVASAELCFGACITLVTALAHRRPDAEITSELPAVAMASVLQLLQHISLFHALSRLSLIRALALTQFSQLWLNSILSPSSTRRALASLLAVAVSVTADITFNSRIPTDALIAHAAPLVHAVASSGLSYAQASIIPKLGRSATHRATLTGAALTSIVTLGIIKLLGSASVDRPEIPWLSYLPILPLAAFFAFSSPIVATRLGLAPPTSHSFIVSVTSVALFAYILSSVVHRLGFHAADIAVALLAAYGSFPSAYIPAQSGSTAHLIRSYLKTIISNPESRKIFYFLMLNMCFMLVQMLYGVWTNSLGLISDAIHMAFDCMAIGMGLMASVMATWAPNEKYTYGYGRIETLSGFANGIFLLLISVFIVFEAIQRLLEPPEMNTNQLLLVSSMGLGVNLFGMFAMGGHHHHGHGHSHGHGHDHGHSHGHSHSHPHSHDHDHDHSHSHAHDPPHSHAHDHSHSHHDHSHPTSRSHSHDRSHSHSPDSHGHHDHSHSHSHSHRDHGHADHDHDCDGHDRDHDHDHSHTHDEKCDHEHEHDHDHDHAHSHEKENGHGHDHHRHDHDHHPVLPEPPTVLVTSPQTPVAHHYDTHYASHHAHRPHTPNAHSHDHHHHAHDHEGHSHNMRGVFLHVMADTLGSVGVIISTLLIQFYGWTGFDPIASIFIAVLIAASVVPLVMDCARVLSLDVGEEREKDVKNALAELQAVEGVAGYTAPRFWPKDAETIVGAIHIQLTPAGALSASSVTPAYANIDKVMARVDALLREKIPGLEELTIQVMAPT